MWRKKPNYEEIARLEKELGLAPDSPRPRRRELFTPPILGKEEQPYLDEPLYLTPNGWAPIHPYGASSCSFSTVVRITP